MHLKTGSRSQTAVVRLCDRAKSKDSVPSEIGSGLKTNAARSNSCAVVQTTEIGEATPVVGILAAGGSAQTVDNELQEPDSRRSSTGTKGSCMLKQEDPALGDRQRLEDWRSPVQ